MSTVEDQKALDARLIDHLGKNRDLVKAEQDIKDGANPNTQNVPLREGERVSLLACITLLTPVLIVNDEDIKKAKRRDRDGMINDRMSILKENISFLIEHGADVNFQNKESKTILAQVRDAAEDANRAGNSKLVAFYRDLDKVLLSKGARLELECNPPTPKQFSDGRESVSGEARGHRVEVIKSSATGGVKIVEEGVGQVTLYQDGTVGVSENTEANAYEVIVAKGPEVVQAIRDAAQAALRCGQFGQADQVLHGLGLGAVKQHDGKGSREH